MKDRRFDIVALEEITGGKVFARGQDYHRDGLVEILRLDAARVVARVAGTEDYRTVVTGRGDKIGGECSCPAFDDWGFCKHMVAVALAANDVATGEETEGGLALERIRGYLETKAIDSLVDMIVDLAERDAVLFRKLEVAAAATSLDDKTLEARLHKAINDATRTRGFVDYGAAADWAAGVDAALDTLGELASSTRAGLVLKLVEHAISRIERAVESIDDSDGHCGALLERAQQLHHQACSAARPEPVLLARSLFARATEADSHTFFNAAAIYEDVLGEEGLAEYRRLASEAWAKLPPKTAARRGTDRHDSDRFRLAAIIDFFAGRDGDVDQRIALRAKDLSSPWNYVQLAEFCLAQGRPEEALRFAEEGLWMFEDGRPDQRLVLLATDLLLKAVRKADAEAHLWGVFQKQPDLGLYGQLRRLGGDAARDRAIGMVEAQIGHRERSQWRWPADLLVGIHIMEEEQFGAAWTAVHKYGASMAAKLSLAMASEVTHPFEAIKVYADRVEELATTGGNPAYEEAAGFVNRMASLREPAELAAYVAELKQRHLRKRNFMKLLGGDSRAKGPRQ